VQVTEYLRKLESRIGYCFQDQDLLRRALTHKSYSNEQADMVAHNERLEFLGDAVLELVVSDWTYRNYPAISEGGLTRIRAEVVSEKGLAEIARKLDLGTGLVLGKGEEKSGGRNKPSLLSNALEALCGAVYEDGGFAQAYTVLERVVVPEIEHCAHLRYGSDYKTCLQERLQSLYGVLPAYIVSETSGPDHQRIYTIEVRLHEQLLASGSGTSKKAAEQKAAAAALDQAVLRNNGGRHGD
jgi:ribonuclease-3